MIETVKITALPARFALPCPAGIGGYLRVEPPVNFAHRPDYFAFFLYLSHHLVPFRAFSICLNV
jgi:hypothetical protein